TSPDEAKAIIEHQSKQPNVIEPQNLEEQAISLVGKDIFNTLIKEYTEKQWGRNCKELPPFIIKRLPVRFTFDNNYFNDKYQGIPIGGYNKLIESLLDGVEVETNTDFFENKEYWLKSANKIVYTGPIDRFFGFEFGELAYRTLEFEHEEINKSNFQGNAVINYIDSQYPYTRIIEHKHFEFGCQEKTIITKEYPKEYSKGDEPYYPVNDSYNNRLFSYYKQKAKNLDNVIFGGRLAEYKYYDMHQVIASALTAVEKELCTE
ncbi:UDP-galactopyranose mutase, partial [Escherichia coli]|nr:UDP-galactopyranose mutase [Escherichia coli]